MLSSAQAGSVDAARRVIREAVSSGVAPCVVAEVGSSGAPFWREAFGIRTPGDPLSPARDATVFDLASLTKPLATASLVLLLEARGRLSIEDPVAAFFPEWRRRDREGATLRDLLEHATGLPPRLLDPPPSSRLEFEHDICATPLAHPVRESALYSDLGFILLGFLIADRGGDSLDALFEELWASASRALDVPSTDRGVLGFSQLAANLAGVAPTRPLDEDPRRGRLLVGEVHDNYAAALGGVAGHAGLFGNAAGVGVMARAFLRGGRGDDTLPVPFAAAAVRRATTRSTVPGSSRALGWDTMLPTSSCGIRMSAAAFGHVGFTGTSLWIDPDRDRYFVLLSNRACGGGTLDEMRAVRRAFHDALGDL